MNAEQKGELRGASKRLLGVEHRRFLSKKDLFVQRVAAFGKSPPPRFL